MNNLLLENDLFGYDETTCGESSATAVGNGADAVQFASASGERLQIETPGGSGWCKWRKGCQMSLATNPQLELAYECILHTNRNVFLTGKAGSGKTTFLQRVRAEAQKRLVVVAPTGVAAINAGGMTIHSLFQLPLGMHIPGAQRQTTQAQPKFSRQKLQLFRTLELLVIDEISMVRADLLDAVDDALRRFRRNETPFGGVQLLMIGDLHQLPPVVKPEEWSQMSKYYETPFFFSSHALKGTDYFSIELKHIYRQSDEKFIALLNKVRDKQIDEQVLRQLNARFIPGFHAAEQEGYITLTATNSVAQSMNVDNLEALPGKSQVYSAKVEGEFPPTAFPTDESLVLKVGAQVMFIRNDVQDKRFFNGKIGKVVRLAQGEVHVRCPDDTQVIPVMPMEWNNIRYRLNETTNQVEEEILGSFTQLPLKLAWAITIHKSQGLTFDRAIIDAQSAFAHGQVYVALSRCKSFEGIVLISPIQSTSIKLDVVVKEFSEQAEQNAPDAEQLQRSKQVYQESLLRELFSFKSAQRTLASLTKIYATNATTLTKEGLAELNRVSSNASAQVFEVAQKFLPRLEQYFSEGLPAGNDALIERMKKAGAYFCEKIDVLRTEFKRIPTATDNREVRKAVSELFTALQLELSMKQAEYKECLAGFTPQGLLRSRKDAEFEFSRTANEGKAEESVPAGVANPDLYVRLRTWRNETADREDLPRASVLPATSLRELAATMPTNNRELKCITGIGKGKVKRYGSQILSIVKEFREKKPDSNEPFRPPATTGTRAVTLELYQSGMSVDQIAAQRGLARSTIENHLSHFVGLGVVSIIDFLDPTKVAEIESYFRSENKVSLSEAKLHFGEKYGYSELRMVAELLRSEPNVVLPSDL
jgi:hypothetical protein